MMQMEFTYTCRLLLINIWWTPTELLYYEGDSWYATCFAILEVYVGSRPLSVVAHTSQPTDLPVPHVQPQPSPHAMGPHGPGQQPQDKVKEGVWQFLISWTFAYIQIKYTMKAFNVCVYRWVVTFLCICGGFVFTCFGFELKPSLFHLWFVAAVAISHLFSFIQPFLIVSRFSLALLLSFI